MKLIQCIMLLLLMPLVNAQTTKTNLKKVKVVNRLDPICGMDNNKFLKDTAIYKKNIYGFCGLHCKTEFKKNPKKYLK